MIALRPVSAVYKRIPNAAFLSLLLVALLSAASAQNASGAPTPGADAAAVSALQELPAQMQAVGVAQQTGDVAKIAAANRSLLAVALRAEAELKLALGDTKQAIDLYQRSLAFEDSPKVRVALAVAYMKAHRTDDALAVLAPVVASDPRNADAWNVQGKLLMDKKSYGPASEALARSLELQSNPLVAYALAMAFLNLNQNDKAEAIFKQITDAAGSNASVHIMIGRAYQNAGKTDEAAREFNQAAAIDAKSSRAHYFAGLLYLSQNEWVATPEAREQFDEEVKVNPNDFFGNFFLGYIENADKLYDDSDRHLKIAAQAQPNWPEPYLYMGLNAFARRDIQKAEELLRKAVALTGDDVSRNNYQIRRAYYVLGRICFQTNRRDEASTYTKTFSEMQEKVDEMSRVNSPASKTMGTMGSGMSAAPSVPTSAMLEPEGQSEAAPQLTPQQKSEVTEAEQRVRAILGEAYNDLGTAEARQKKYSDALANFQQAERWNPAIPHLMRNVGFAAFRASQHAEAARALKIAEQQEPTDKMIPPMLAMSLFSSDQFAEAVKVFGQMGDAVYGDPRVTYAYAVSLARSGQKEQATAVVNRMAQKQLPPDGMLLVGQAYVESDDPQQALSTIQTALQANPSLTKAHYYAGLAQLKLKQPSQAITEFEAELKLNPADADAQFQLGKALMAQGRAKDALPHLEVAAKATPKIDGVHAELAAAYRKLGRNDDAVRETVLAETEKATAPTSR